MRRFIAFAINKSTLNHVFLLLILVVSVFSYLNISKEIFPPVQMDKIVINGAYAGASAKTLDHIAVNEIEEELKNLNAIAKVSSLIQNNLFSITADLKDGASKELALSEVKDIIAQVKDDFPTDMKEPTAKIVEEAIPLVFVAVSSKADKQELIKLAKEVKLALSKFKDLSEVIIRGESDEELSIELNKAKIKALGLEYFSVVEALKNISSIFPVGSIKEQGNHLFVSTINGEKQQTLVENMLLSVSGKKIALKEVAKVSFELANPETLSHFNGVQNLSITINKSKQGNAIALVKEIEILLEGFKNKYKGVSFNLYTDTSVWIKNRLNTVISNISFGLILVFLALLFFVNSTISLVVIMGIPLSFMIGLISMEMLGYSLNMLSLLGALIALGMLVDEAIVVAENIYRHLEEGKDRLSAAIDGALEMFPAVLTATATTIFAFLPLLTLSGEMGVFIKVLPIIISILLLSSLFEAFFFLPLHAKDFLRVRKKEARSHTLWYYLYAAYEKLLQKMLVHKKLSLSLILVFVLSFMALFIKHLKFQLFPDFDVTQIYITGKLDVNNALEDTEKKVFLIEETLLKSVKQDEVASISSTIGIKLNAKNKAEFGEHLFHIFIDLHEKAPDNFFNTYINPYFSPNYDASRMIRKRTAQTISKDFLALLEQLKSQNPETFEEVGVVVPGAGVVAYDVEIALNHENEALAILALERLKAAIKSQEGVYNIADDAQKGVKELKLRVNAYGYKLGFSEAYLQNYLASFYLEGEHAKMFDKSGIVNIRLKGLQKDKITSLKNLFIQVPNSKQKVALTEVCDFILQDSFLSINKENARHIFSVYASLNKEKTTSSELMKKISPLLDTLRNEGIRVDVKGEEKENQRVQVEVAQSAIIALFLIFMALIAMFNKVRLALMVLSIVPLSILGVFIGHFVMGLNMTVTGMIGIVGLAGVVVNDGLIMVDFLKRSQSMQEVIVNAKKRLRPILLTSITTVLGLSTLMFFASGQSLILQPLAVALGFGLIWATFLNLFYLPLLYSVTYKIK